jgi:glycosyltransferase involved in cell wall biosynthesis
MCRGLARNGWEVLLVAPAPQPMQIESVKVIPIRSPRARALRVLLGGWRAVREASLLDVDLYHLHDPELLMWAWYLRRKGKPVIYDMHEFVGGAIRSRPWIPSSARSLLARVWTWFEKRALRDSAVVFAERSYARHYPWIERSATVLNLPEAQTLLDLPNVSRSSDRIVYVGRISPTRGSVTMLRALRLLQDRGIDAQLDLVGQASPEHARELDELASSLGLKRVRFHGYKAPAEAWCIANGATAGLAVLNAEPNYVESYPTKMFEYMALSIPVIVSDFPLYRSVVEGADCGLCIPPQDPRALADALQSLLESPDLARRYGNNGRAAILKSYRWDTQLTQLESLYTAELAR